MNEPQQLAIRIERNTDPSPRTLSKDLDIYVNGVLQTNVRNLHLKIEAQQVVTATIEYFPTEVSVDADVLTEISQ